MTAVTPPPLVGLGVATLVLVAVAALGAAWSSTPVTPTTTGRSPAPAPASTPSLWHGLGAQRIAAGAAAGFVVLLITRWLVLAAAASALSMVWGRLLRDERAERERERIEAIAKWLEDLRDTLRGSSVGAEEALEQVARRPPAAIHEAMTMFLLRRRQGFRTEDALADLAEELAHPTADAAIAAIRLVVGGTAGGGRLYHTVSALAASTRDELRARERVDRTRAVYQSSMKRLVIIGAVLIAYLRFAAGDLLDPYGTPTGQAFLALPMAMWAGCVLWLRRLCRYDLPARYRIVGSTDIEPDRRAFGEVRP